MSTSLRRSQGLNELRLCRRATPVWFMGPSRSPGTKSSLTSWLPANATRRVVGLSRASLVLHRRRWAPRRFSWPSRDGAGFHRTTVEHLPGLHSTSESLAQPRPKFGRSPVGFVRSRVASGSVCTAPGLPWTPQIAPPSVRPRASTPGRPCGLPSASEVPPPKSRSVLVVSHHLDGFLRARPAGLLHPAADPGVRRVSRCASTSIAGLLAETSRTRTAASPRRSSYPPKIPSTAAAPHRWGRGLLGVRSHIAARVHPQGVARRSNPMVAPPACAVGTPSSFLGFAPRRGHPEPAFPRRFLPVRSVLGRRLRGGRVSLGRSFRNAGPRETRIRSLPRLHRLDCSGRPPRKSVRTGMSVRLAAGSNRFDQREFTGPPWGL